MERWVSFEHDLTCTHTQGKCFPLSVLSCLGMCLGNVTHNFMKILSYFWVILGWEHLFATLLHVYSHPSPPPRKWKVPTGDVFESLWGCSQGNDISHLPAVHHLHAAFCTVIIFPNDAFKVQKHTKGELFPLPRVGSKWSFLPQKGHCGFIPISVDASCSFFRLSG